VDATLLSCVRAPHSSQVGFLDVLVVEEELVGSELYKQLENVCMRACVRVPSERWTIRMKQKRYMVKSHAYVDDSLDLIGISHGA
jgi:hypothetical protein